MTLNYEFDCSIDDDNFCRDVDVVINENCIKLITAFLFEKKFGIPYRELGWWLEPGAKEWVKEIEDAWFHNKLNMLIFRDDYIEFLWNYYKMDAISRIEQEIQSDLDEGYWDNSDDDEEDDEDEEKPWWEDIDKDHDIHDISIILEDEEVLDSFDFL